MTIVNAMAQQLAMQASSAVGSWFGAVGSAAGAVTAATGGYISGPGTATSDSIPAWLSNGEFVVRAASVSRYGLGFLHAINRGQLPRFATGGLVSAPAAPRYREPGLSQHVGDERQAQAVASPVNIQPWLLIVPSCLPQD
ncbi:hypothetical protein [[Haemophilus] ducreyi]|uniref:hypothetical protein n=1 Tax=Haemophilus ducreyi TaxID=730 RepID=UPI001E5231D6|nr:hypothetical protein [[Haemophilus] ducreyi]